MRVETNFSAVSVGRYKSPITNERGCLYCIIASSNEPSCAQRIVVDRNCKFYMWNAAILLFTDIFAN